MYGGGLAKLMGNDLFTSTTLQKNTCDTLLPFENFLKLFMARQVQWYGAFVNLKLPPPITGLVNIFIACIIS